MVTDASQDMNLNAKEIAWDEDDGLLPEWRGRFPRCR
jgi:hypothetical protein